MEFSPSNLARYVSYGALSMELSSSASNVTFILSSYTSGISDQLISVVVLNLL